MESDKEYMCYVTYRVPARDLQWVPPFFKDREKIEFSPPLKLKGGVPHTFVEDWYNAGRFFDDD